MSRPRLLLGFAALTIGLGLLGGCRTPSYDDQTACAMPADAVETLMGTDRYTAGGTEVADLPFTEDSTKRTASCRVEADDVSLLVSAQTFDTDEVARRAALLTEVGTTDELDGGTIGYDAKNGGWACGTVWTEISLTGADGDEDAMRTAITAVAEAAGCPGATG